MTRGIVKWFSDAKGFGFINAEGLADDIFAHYSAITMEGFRSLRPGMAVEFKLVDTDKGFLAQEIAPLTPYPSRRPSAEVHAED